MTQEDRIKTVEVDPVVECRHSQQERCHLTYITAFTPSRQQVCKAGMMASHYAPQDSLGFLYKYQSHFPP